VAFYDRIFACCANSVAWQGAHGKLVYMKIATWNVNSIRARADRIEDWLDKTEVDVLALQETKTKDETFPFELFEFLGYEVAHYGLNQWNGVAIASRVGLDSVERTFPNQPAFGNASISAPASTVISFAPWIIKRPSGMTRTGTTSGASAGSGGNAGSFRKIQYRYELRTFRTVAL